MPRPSPSAFRPGPIHLRSEPAWRFLTGTPNIPALYSCRAGYRIVAGVGQKKIRERSLALTQHLMELATEAGFELRTPRNPEQRGGTVSIWHPEAERLCHELIDREIMCDYRPRAGIRMSPHFYNTEAELDHAVAVLKELAGG
jgi:kynureninase